MDTLIGSFQKLFGGSFRLDQWKNRPRPALPPAFSPYASTYTVTPVIAGQA